jgi:CheY-like chemotaxis protein
MPPIPSTHYIIYADDDNDDLELMTECFNKHAQNVELVAFHNGLEAFSFLNSLSPSDPSPCLIILDINMPLLNGRDVVQKIRLRKKFEKVPIVLFTTSSQPVDKLFARQYNVGFITKPLNFRQMDVIVDGFIEYCTEDVKKEIRKKVEP